MRPNCLSLLLLFACLSTAMKASVDDFTSLELSGWNADAVATPGETSAGDAPFMFYSEQMCLQGGLPQRLRGMYSDVPYSIADFTNPCALLLDGSQTTEATLKIGNATTAHSLWLLATAPDGTATITVTVGYADGTTEAPQQAEIAQSKSLSVKGTAYWQLGAYADGAAQSSDCRYALYEICLPISKTDANLSAITIALADDSPSAMILAATASAADVPSATADKRLFLISDSHLDTQWNWTVKTTINEYVKNTLEQNFSLFEKYPDFEFNFEGAIKYMWAKEYYPALYTKLKDYIKQGRWHIAGGAIDANDVNIGSGESIIRNFLLGQTFYKTEFGERGGRDVMLPDCFGFPYSLPTLAAHCGMRYFHTQKLSWSSAYAFSSLPRLARWRGVDGSELLSALKMGAYDEHEAFRKDLSNDADLLSAATSNNSSYSIPAALRYVGPRSDHGGGLDETTTSWLSKSQDGTGQLKVGLGSATDILGQVFHMGYSRLPIINHGLPMRAHGVGGYTSKTMLKYWNRRGETLAEAAEKASAVASWLGSLDYQQTTINNAWTRILYHQFHDDLPGTCIDEAYKYTTTDLFLSQLDLSRTLDNAVGAVVNQISTESCDGQAVVVYNPLSISRTDIVEATINLPQEMQGISVSNAAGETVLSQIVSRNGNEAKIIFLATVPSLGYAAYNITTTTEPQSLSSELNVSTTGMENSRYRITIDQNGDVSSIIDKQSSNRELLSSPIRLALLFDESVSWPSWEIHGDQLQKAPREYVDSEGLQIEVAENGPLRVSLKITRSKSGSAFCQYIRLAAAGACDRVDFENEVNWQTRERMLKACFPLTASNPKATYALAIGAEQNDNSTDYSTDVNNTTSICEFLGHRWADVTDQSGLYGVSIVNDGKYGWDKQTDNEIRLTLIHTPKVGSQYAYQGAQDLGLNRFTYSIYAHDGSWDASTPWQADRLGLPLRAYSTTAHAGQLGSEASFAQVSTPQVAVKALKKAEQSDQTIIRFYELEGKECDVDVSFAADIVSAREVNGVEEYLAEASISGNTLSFHINGFAPKTFAVSLSAPSAVATKLPESAHVALSYDVDAVSTNDNRKDADISKSYPAELVPQTVEADGISFAMGKTDDGEKNALRCQGQTLSLPQNGHYNKAYLLLASLNEDGSEVTFSPQGADDVTLQVPYYGGTVAEFGGKLGDKIVYRIANTALTATHSHSSGGDNTMDYLYMYKVVLPISGATESLTLPDCSDLLVFAITLSDNINDDAQPLTQSYSTLDYVDVPSTDELFSHADEALQPQTITASGQVNNAEAAEFAADGDTNTKWCQTGDTQKWIEYDFGRDVVVTAWRVVNAGSEAFNSIARTYSLQRKTHNGWVDVDFVDGNVLNITDRTLSSPIVTSAIRVRYIHADQDDEKAGTARLYELAVYGHNASDEERSSLPMIISRMPTYGQGKQMARVVKTSGYVKTSEAPRCLFDNDPTTKWCSNSGSKPYVTVELAMPCSLTRFDIYDAMTNENAANSDGYTIEVSTDGENFTTVADVSGVADDDIHTSILPEAVTARFVRLSMEKGGGGAVRVYAFDIWGIELADEPTAEVDYSKSLAIQKTILASNNNPDEAATALKLIDGDLSVAGMAWMADQPGSAEPYAFALINLEDNYSLNEFRLYDAASVSDGSGVNIKGLRIYVTSDEPSADDLAYIRTHSSVTGWKRVAMLQSAGDQSTKIVTLDEPVEARYVLLSVPRTYIDASGLSLYELEIYGNDATGIAATESQNISIWPLCVSRGETINISSPCGSAYTLYGYDGKTVATGRADAQTKLQTASLSAGIYLLKATDGTHNRTERIIVR